MPESKKRKQKEYTAPQVKGEKQAVNFDSPRWLPIVMVACWVLGLAWIVLWYMVPIPFMKDLGSWNILIGFGFIAAGFMLATKWR